MSRLNRGKILRAIELRKEGLTWAVITERLGFSSVCVAIRATRKYERELMKKGHVYRGIPYLCEECLGVMEAERVEVNKYVISCVNQMCSKHNIRYILPKIELKIYEKTVGLDA